MSKAPLPSNEQQRLTALRSYHILDTATEQDFDELTELASVICGTPIALISLVDQGRQWFKSHKGLEISETDKAYSFCAHAINAPDTIMEVEDAHTDERFKNNPFVTGDPNVTFYAGVPLVNEDGFALGSLCVIDSIARKLSGQQLSALRTLARQVMDKLELKRKVYELKQAQIVNNELHAELTLSSARNRMLIEQAPVAIILFRGENMYIEAVNPPMLTLLGKKGDILNKPLLEAMPELAGQPPYELLYKVYTTGEPVYGYDTPVVLNRDDKQSIGYYNFSYTPLIENDRIVGVIDMAVEVTSQVIARKELENAQDKLKMALDGAELGVWSADMSTGLLTLSDRTRMIHGIPEDVEIALTEAFAMIREDYREKITCSINQAMQHNAHLAEEYPIQPMDGSPQRWLKVNGKAYYNEEGTALNITGTLYDITEQKQDEQRKNDFIAMVSHELKTPLTSLKGYLQILQIKASKANDAMVTNLLDKASRQASKMVTMINGFLNVSRLESGKIHIDRQHFDMADLVKEAESEAVLMVSTHRLIFEPVTATIVNADMDKIGQVINNFISNAVKYSPNGTTIQVACITKNGNVQVSVRDEGMGIAPENIEKLFDRYYRVKGAQMKSIAGFGIGLYLCAEIIQRHGGHIGVESKIGKGSTFYFTLPIEA